MRGRARVRSKERNKQVLGAKINRSLPDFKSLTTKLRNKRRCRKTGTCTHVADLAERSTFPVHIIISLFSRRNMSFETRQYWVQIPGFVFTSLSDLGESLNLSEPQFLQRYIRWRSRCLLLGLL